MVFINKKEDRMIRNLIYASVCSALSILCNFDLKAKNLISRAVLVFIVTFIGCMFINLCFACETPKTCSLFLPPICEKEIDKVLDSLGDIIALSNIERQEFIKKVEFHDKWGKYNLDMAQNKCWWLPDVSDREKAQWCWVTFMGSVAGTTPPSKVVCGLLSFLTQYGLNCIDEWDEIKTLLNWAEYHYNMKEFYENVLVKG